MEDPDRYAPIVQDFNEYILALRDERRLEPTDDILSVLANSKPMSVNGLPDGEPLTDLEFASMMQVLIVGAGETTLSATLAIVRTLATRPDLFETLKADRSLIPAFVEEMLRIELPLQGFFRVTKADTELGGVEIPAGSIVFLRYGSANRDESVFENPNEIRLDRKNNPHVSFGHGIHHCIGQMLARKELNLLTATLCDRFKSMALAPEDKGRYANLFNVRCLESLDVLFEAA